MDIEPPNVLVPVGIFLHSTMNLVNPKWSGSLSLNCNTILLAGYFVENSFRNRSRATYYHFQAVERVEKDGSYTKE